MKTEINQAARETFGNLIKALRNEKNMTLQQLGEIVGKDRSHISSIENGKFGISLDTAASIAEAFGCKVAMVDGEGKVPVCTRDILSVSLLPPMEAPGQHPMTDEQIAAFMAQPSKYGVPPVATPQNSAEGPCVNVAQLVQVIAQMGGYRVTLEKI